LERRKMFGYPGAFVSGNMFASLHGEKMIVRLPDAERQALLATPGARIFEPMAGRPMREYVVVPDSILADLPTLRIWTEKAFDYAMTLAPKEKKKSTRPRAARKP